MSINPDDDYLLADVDPEIAFQRHPNPLLFDKLQLTDPARWREREIQERIRFIERYLDEDLHRTKGE